MKQTLLSWNVNGLRAVEKKGFYAWFSQTNCDVLSLQETKLQSNQIPESLKNPLGYHSYWNHAERKGYSGVVTFSKIKPLSVQYGFGIKKYDTEGRTLILEYDDFYLLNIYFPNGQKNNDRLHYKLEFYEVYLAYVKKLLKDKHRVIVCGDVNTAHREIDLARPKENEKRSGFLPEERVWLDEFVASGLVDTFRHVSKDGGHYTWWDYKTRARERNVGWRIDYFYIDNFSINCLCDAFILSDVIGSDHCPIGITIKI